MLPSVVLHAVRRGLQHPATTHVVKRMTGHENDKIEVPSWGIALLAFTSLVFIVFLGSVQYTIEQVILPLAMVETPNAAITVSPSEDDFNKDVKEGLLETGPKITIINQKPITSSIRATVRYLVSTAGRLARWRGLLNFFLYNTAFTMVAQVFESFIPRFMPLSIMVVAGLSGAVVANLHAAYIHKVISMPSDLSVWRRIPSRSSWRQLALPGAINAAAAYTPFYIAASACYLMGLEHSLEKYGRSNNHSKEATFIVLRVFGAVAIIIASSLFISLPATVTDVRVGASILPEDEDTIVPFDRTFEGKVVPKVLGGTGAIGFLDAWKSFKWEARRRIIKLYLKTFAIVFMIMIVFVHVIALELWAVMGPQLGEALARAKQNAAAL